MNGNNLFLDTNIIIYFLSGDNTLTDLLEGKSIFISVITKLELLSFHEMSSRDQQRIEKFISECSVVDLNINVQEAAIQIRKKYKLKLPDSIVVASAQYVDLPLISADKSLRAIKEGSIVYYEKK
ncbi:MAG: type II toxin-antitoxin system VapC family toxin [Cyclobacteriaceae bacterium]|nr:type II toxin-antitoxin system VapC family toxin [Cyclobacteriaceae bacterium]